jgi:predicted amidohydrolase YtcJ
MKRAASVVLTFALLAAGCGATASPDSVVPTTVETPGRGSGITLVTNAVLYTMNREMPWAESFAFDASGVIVGVGDESSMRQMYGADASILDAGGRFVMPGFQDAHVHVPEAGINEYLCEFPPGGSLDAYAEIAVACADEQPGGGWVVGAGASLFDLRNNPESPIDALDAAVPDRPVLILDDLGHAVWVNTLGMAAAGFSEGDDNPPGGILHRDRTGRLTGLLLENAQHRARDAAAFDADTVYDGLLGALESLAANGVTSVSDAGGYWTRGHPGAWLRAEDEGVLTVRAHNSLYVFPDRPFEEQLDELAAWFSDDPGRLVQFDTAKIYVDGILDLGTARLLGGYSEPIDPDYPEGFLYFEPDTLFEYTTALHDIGFRINFHVIGDAAVRLALDAIEIIGGDAAQRHHRTTHTYLVADTDLARFAALGVIADIQAGPESTDPEYHAFLADFIGDRAFDLIPVGDLLRAEAAVLLSSDWDADPLSPLGNIQQLLQRESQAAPDLATALHMLTLEPARALGHNDVTGSIEVGKFADFVILDADPFSVSTSAIGRIRVELTALGGDIVFSAPGLVFSGS